jgi:phage replication-related protein YjqB (UPF0714/DUF867 family)
LALYQHRPIGKAALSMADKYKSFSHLAQAEKHGKDFIIRTVERRSAIAVIAPHGGGIEPGTSEIAEAIAGDDLSFYAFEGKKRTDNRDLHITSARIDEPQGLALVKSSESAIAIHGENDDDQQVVFIGGGDAALCARLRDALVKSGFVVQKHKNPDLQGTHEANICNRGKSGLGVQLELTNALRASFFESLTRNGRKNRTERFEQFVAAVRTAITDS